MIPQFTATDFFVLKPILLLSLFGCGILILDFLIKDPRMRWWNAMTALLGEIITGVAIWQHQQDLGGAAIQGLGGAIVVDGFITTAAFALAWRICPEVLEYAFFAHRSVEPGHAALLELMEVEPILDLSLRLGEGTGAALAIPILDAAAAAHNEMATFESAGVSGKSS